MKKIVALFVLITVMLGVYAEEQFLWCKRLFLNEPTTHIIQKGEYFSKLSKQYYGTARYWRELALINRAPNSDLVFPGEKVVVPSLDAIKKLHRSRSLSSVNKIVAGQEKWIAQHGASPSAEFATDVSKGASEEQVTTNQTASQVKERPEVSATMPSKLEESRLADMESEESSSFPVAMIIVAAVVIVALIVFYLYKRKKKSDWEDLVFADEDEETSSAEESEGSDNAYSDSFDKRRQDEILVS